MKKGIKLMALISVLFVVFSLIGCSSNTEQVKEIKDKTKTVESTNKTEQSVPEETKEDQTTEQESASVSTEKEESEKQVAEASTSTQASQDSQTENGASKVKSTVTATAPKSNPTTSPTTSNTANAGTTTTPKPTPEAPKPQTTVTLSIIGPKDRGTILASSKVPFKDGETIFDIIKNETKKQGIAVESRGSGATAYIEGIDNIYEFDYGVKSGWIFKQNGSSITKSIGVIKVKDGDRIECFYTE